MLALLRRWGLLPAEPAHLRAVGRMVLLAGLVGVVAGLGAVAFQFLSHLVLKYGLEFVAGYKPAGPTGEWSIFSAIRPIFGGFSPWLLLAVITVGGLLSGFIVYSLAPEAEGHGTDAAIKAYHKDRAIIRPVVPLVKIVCSALTLGSGGSGGREGPIAQIGAGFGSYLARVLKLSESRAADAAGRRPGGGHRGHLQGAAGRRDLRHRGALPRRGLRGRGADPRLHLLHRRLLRVRADRAVRLRHRLGFRPAAGRPARPEVRQPGAAPAADDPGGVHGRRLAALRALFLRRRGPLQALQDSAAREARDRRARHGPVRAGRLPRLGSISGRRRRRTR